MTAHKLGDRTSVRLGLSSQSPWPVVITAANRSEAHLSDDEARELMRLLICRYPIDALGALSEE